MAASAQEKYAARIISDSEAPSAETTWHVFGAADEIEAYAALAAAPIPALYTFPSGKIAYLANVQIKDVYESTREQDLTHEATLSYSYKAPITAGDIEYEFEVAAQSVTLTHAIDTTAYTGGGRTAPNFNKGINISPDGKIQGISVERAQFSFQVTKHWPAASVTQAYQIVLANLASRVNNASFYGLPAGSVKFLGARGRLSGDKFPITYRFEYSPNETGVTVGDITGIARQGWQYLDVYRRTISDDTAKKKTEVPHSVYIHKVFEDGDFSLIGL